MMNWRNQVHKVFDENKDHKDENKRLDIGKWFQGHKDGGSLELKEFDDNDNINIAKFGPDPKDAYDSIFHSFGPEAVCEYKGYQPAVKIVDPNLGSKSFVRKHGDKLDVDSAIAAEFYKATCTSTDADMAYLPPDEIPADSLERFNFAQIKFLLNGELDFRVCRSQKLMENYQLSQTAAEDIYHRNEIQERQSAVRVATKNSLFHAGTGDTIVYEHGKNSYEYYRSLDRPLPQSLLCHNHHKLEKSFDLLKVFEMVKADITEYKAKEDDQILGGGNPVNEQILAGLYGLQMYVEWFIKAMEKAYSIEGEVIDHEFEADKVKAALDKENLRCDTKDAEGKKIKREREAKIRKYSEGSEVPVPGDPHLVVGGIKAKLFGLVDAMQAGKTVNMLDRVVSFDGCHGFFSKFAAHMLPQEWNKALVPYQIGPSQTMVPGYIMPTNQANPDKAVSQWQKELLGIVNTILLLSFTGFAVFFIIHEEERLNNINSLLVPGALFLLKTIIPKVVELTVSLEKWDDPEREVNLNMMRQYFLKISNIFILYQEVNTAGAVADMSQCVEAVGGLLFYKLIVTNSILGAISNTASYGGFYWYQSCRVDNPRTPIGSEIVAQLYVDMNYNQALFLMGLVYAPALPVTFFLLNWGEMYVLCLCFKYFCKLSEKPFEQKNKNSTFMYLFITSGISLSTLAIFLFQKPADLTSEALFCGPFARDQSRYICVSEWFKEEMPTFITEALQYFMNPMFVYAIVVFIFVALIFSQSNLNSVRDSCVNAEWQLRMLTRRLQHATKSNASSGEEMEAELNTIRGELDAKSDKLIKEQSKISRLKKNERTSEVTIKILQKKLQAARAELEAATSSSDAKKTQ